jgi:2-methylcitrate dehydratase
MSTPLSNTSAPPDQVLADIADYVLSYKIESTLALDTAFLC